MFYYIKRYRVIVVRPINLAWILFNLIKQINHSHVTVYTNNAQQMLRNTSIFVVTVDKCMKT